MLVVSCGARHGSGQIYGNVYLGRVSLSSVLYATAISRPFGQAGQSGVLGVFSSPLAICRPVRMRTKFVGQEAGWENR